MGRRVSADDNRRSSATALLLFTFIAVLMASLVFCGISSKYEALPADDGALVLAREELRREDPGLFSNDTEADIDSMTSGSTCKAIYSIDGEVTIKGHTMVGSSCGPVADLHANGDIRLQGATIIHDEVAATGTVCIRGKARAGSIQEFVPAVYGPEIILSKYSREADEGIYWNGTCQIEGPCCVGPMYVAGDLIVTNCATVDLCGAIYVEGDIRLSAGCRITGSGVLVAEGDISICGEVLLDGDCDRLVVSAYGDVKLTGDGYVKATLYAPHGGVFLSGNCAVVGPVIGLNVTCAGNSSVNLFFS